MSIENDRLLPVLSSALPEEFRLAVARNDVVLIADRAKEQIEVHQYATRTAREIILTQVEVPHSDRIYALFDKFDAPDKTEGSTKERQTVDSIARKLVGSQNPDAPTVEGKHIARDLFAGLHPNNHQEGSEEHRQKTKIFQELDKDDNTLVQSTYAATVADAALKVEQPSVSQLERSRYKTLIAQQAGKGRFETIDDVDEWHEQELEAKPIRARAHMFGTAWTMYVKALGATEGKPWGVPAEHFAPIKAALDRTSNALEGILGEDSKPELIKRIDTEMFDKKMGFLVENLDILIRSHNRNTSIGGNIDWYFGALVAGEISEIARVLQGYNWTDEVALQGLLATLGMSKKPTERISPTTHKSRGMFPDRSELSNNLYNKKDNFRY